MEQWDCQKEFSKELEFCLQVEEPPPLKMAEVSPHWDQVSLCSFFSLSTLYFYAQSRVGQRLHPITLKLQQCNKIKVISYSYHNPGCSCSAGSFRLVAPPSSEALRSSLFSGQLGRGHRESTFTSSLLWPELGHVSTCRCEGGREIQCNCVPGGKRKRFQWTYSFCYIFLSFHPSLSHLCKSNICIIVKNAELSTLQSQSTGIQVQVLLLVAV